MNELFTPRQYAHKAYSCAQGIFFHSLEGYQLELFGEDVLGRTDQEWGLDEEGEINGSYKPCGLPGVSLVMLFLVDNADHRRTYSFGLPQATFRPRAYTRNSS